MIPIRDTIPHRHTPVMTLVLIAANLAAFAFELSLSPAGLRDLFDLCGVVPARYTDPLYARRHMLPAHDYWPFLTSMFLHGGWLHLIGNLWTLWIFGDNVEDRTGHAGVPAVLPLLRPACRGRAHGHQPGLDAVPPSVLRARLPA